MHFSFFHLGSLFAKVSCTDVTVRLPNKISQSPPSIRVLWVVSCLWMWAVFEWALPIGWVGEVTSMWGPIPQTTVDGPISCIGDFCLYPTRPIMRLNTLPIFHNVYTASFPDWPLWMLYNLTESPTFTRFAQIGFAGSTMSLLVYMTRSYLSPLSQWFLWLWLAMDWNFLFYKKALGNTELLLQLSWMTCVIALMRRIPSEHQISSSIHHCVVPLAIAVGCLCKITFLLNILPLFIGTYWLRPSQRHTWIGQILMGLVIGMIPSLLLLYWTSGMELPVRSHDFWTLQWERVLTSLSGENTSMREQHQNGLIWLLDPLSFFEQSYGVSTPIWHGWGKVLVLLTCGALLVQQRLNQKTSALTVLLAVQVLGLTWIAKDLHHLAMATPLLSLWMVWVLQESRMSPIFKYTLCGLWLGSQSWILYDTPRIINTVETPTFSEQSQQRLVTLLEKHSVTDLMTMDYEVYGVLEVSMPNLSVHHAWPSISTQRWNALPDILQDSVHGHLIILQSSTPMIYNLSPSLNRLQSVAEEVNLSVTLIDTQEGVWLYSVEPIK